MWLVILGLMLFGAAILFEVRSGRKTALKITLGLLSVFIVVVAVFAILGMGNY